MYFIINGVAICGGIPYRHFGSDKITWKDIYDSISLPMSHRVDKKSIVNSNKITPKRIHHRLFSIKHKPRRTSFSGMKSKLQINFDTEKESMHKHYRGKSCYCKDCGGIKYYEKFQRKINVFPLPEFWDRFITLRRSTRYAK